MMDIILMDSVRPWGLSLWYYSLFMSPSPASGVAGHSFMFMVVFDSCCGRHCVVANEIASNAELCCHDAQILTFLLLLDALESNPDLNGGSQWTDMEKKTVLRAICGFLTLLTLYLSFLPLLKSSAAVHAWSNTHLLFPAALLSVQPWKSGFVT